MEYNVGGNKYLSELGLKKKEQGLNYLSKKKRKAAIKEYNKTGLMRAATYNLDTYLIEVIYSNLRNYCDVASNYIDEPEMLKEINDIAEIFGDFLYYKTNYEWGLADINDTIEERNDRAKKTYQKIEEAFSRLGKVLPGMWW